MNTRHMPHCPRGTLKGTAPKGDNGRCLCAACRKHQGAKRLARYKSDPVFRERCKLHTRNRPREFNLWNNAKSRARREGLPFNITPEDCVIPSHCPVLGLPLVIGRGKLTSSSPTLDKIIPELGYVKGNVAVISHRANRIKSDASAAELLLIARWVQAYVA